MGPASFPDNIKLLIYDCDGVLTDNKVIVDEKGNESVSFNRSDGLAIGHIKKLGLSQLVLSGETNPVVTKRCEKLKIEAITGSDNKETAVREYCKKMNIPVEDVLFIGNDINDLDAMRIVGFCGCPSDAEEEIKEVSQWVSTKKGGDGVIRELLRVITDAKKKND